MPQLSEAMAVTSERMLSIPRINRAAAKANGNAGIVTASLSGAAQA